MQYLFSDPFLFCRPKIIKTLKNYPQEITDQPVQLTLLVSSAIRLSDFVQISLTEAPTTQRSMTAFKVPARSCEIKKVSKLINIQVQFISRAQVTDIIAWQLIVLPLATLRCLFFASSHWNKQDNKEQRRTHSITEKKCQAIKPRPLSFSCTDRRLTIMQKNNAIKKQYTSCYIAI